MHMPSQKPGVSFEIILPKVALSGCLWDFIFAAKCLRKVGL